MKTCTRCGKEGDNSDFQIRKASKDGYSSSCKECLRLYDKSRASLPHRVKARKDYSKTEEGMEAARRGSRKHSKTEKGKASAMKWKLANLDKRKVHGIVAYRIKIGELTRLPCEVCGNEKSEAHHDDYEKPLEVRWLCRKHHAEHHKT